MLPKPWSCYTSLRAGLVALISLFSGMGQARAGNLAFTMSQGHTVLYDNGPANDDTSSAAAVARINGGNSVTNSFTLSSAATVSEVNFFLLEANNGNVGPSGLHWSLGTSAFASDVAARTTHFDSVGLRSSLSG